MRGEPFRLTFVLGDLRGHDALGGPQLDVLLEALVRTNMLRARSGLPFALLSANERPRGSRALGVEEWQDEATAARVGCGNAVDILCRRVARLRLQGYAARARALVRGSSWLPVFDAGSERTIVGGARALPDRLRVIFALDMFDGTPKSSAEEALWHGTLDVLLEALTTIDENYLRARPRTPNLYTLSRRILYMEEPPGQEDWQDVATCLRMGLADCEDLGCWRAAEARVRERKPASTRFTHGQTDGGATLYHITTVVAGKPEDPSHFFGMR